MATLEQFLRTGELGAIHPGMTESEALALLGPPPDESAQRAPRILKYGGLQISFARSVGNAEPRLVLVGLYFHAPIEPLPDAVVPTDFPGLFEATLAEMRAFIDRVGLRASEVSEGEDARLEFRSGAQVVFCDQKLWSILFAARNPAPQKKQISISIPEDVWQELNTLARQSNRSVSELCAQRITQRASDRPHTAQ